MHCFGHIHEGYGTTLKSWEDAKSDRGKVTATIARSAQKQADVQQLKLVPGQDTLMVNAAIMDDRNQPTNALWIVELPIASMGA